MNALNICFIAIVLVSYASAAEESHQLSLVERTPNTIWDEFNEELRNATQGTEQFMKYGVKAAVETLKSTILNEIEILYRLHNSEAVVVRTALLEISNLIEKVEEKIQAMDGSMKPGGNVGTWSTDGLEALMQRIQLLNQLLDMLSKVINTVSPSPDQTTTSSAGTDNSVGPSSTTTSSDY